MTTLPLAVGLGWGSLYLLIGGTALFLLGIQMASEGMRRAAGGRLRALFAMVAKSRLAGLAAGFGITAMLQSSSASTVVLVGLADAGLISAVQSSAMILGADVGTTLVPQILAFKIAEWGLLAVALGYVVHLAARWQVGKNVGWAITGFGLLFYGMHVMSLAVGPLKDDPQTADMLRHLAGNPWLSFAVATALTGVIQSSGATVALAMALAAQGVIPPGAALPIVVGANVGTCVTALLAAVGAGHEGRKVAITHLGFKLLAALMIMPFVAWLGLGEDVADWSKALGAGPERSVANVHTAFNVLMAVAFLPFCGTLALLFGKLVPRKATTAEKISRDLMKKLSGQPAAAILAAEKFLTEMGARCAGMLSDALEVLEKGGARRIEEVRKRDDEVDAIFVALNESLSRIAQWGLSAKNAARQTRILYLARLFEEAGDLVSRELTKLAAKRADNDVIFSMGALAALKRFGGEAVTELQRVAAVADREGLTNLPAEVASTERVDEEARRLIAEHFDQVCRGVAEAGQTGSIYPDAIAALRDLRRTTAEIARVLATRPGESEVVA
jgi:phosphate:Na+ symporter